jgi:hypothetical protein
MSSRQNPGMVNRRKAGAPAGNKNALIHGLYAKRIPPEDAQMLEFMGNRLEGEIALLRTHINGLAAKLDSSDYDENALRQLTCMGDLIIKVVTATRTLAWMTGRLPSTARNAVSAILQQRNDWSKVLK